jgi:hypothetical protein
MIKKRKIKSKKKVIKTLGSNLNGIRTDGSTA